jgi:PAS domain S-box-containing protein
MIERAEDGVQPHAPAQPAGGGHASHEPADPGRDEASRIRDTRIRAVYDGMKEYIGLLSPEGELLDCNRASLEFIGNTRTDVVGRLFWDTPWFAYTPGAPERVRAGVARAAAGEVVREELTLQRPSAAPITFAFSLHPVTDEHGNVEFIVPEGRDVTDQKRAAAALRESEARYRTLFDSIDEGFCVVEVLFDEQYRPVDYRWTEANPAFMEQTGLTDPVGRTARELVPSLEEHWFETYGRVALTGEPIRFQNGSEPMGRWFDVFAFRIGAPEERLVALLFKDVTAERTPGASGNGWSRRSSSSAHGCARCSARRRASSSRSVVRTTSTSSSTRRITSWSATAKWSGNRCSRGCRRCTTRASRSCSTACSRPASRGSAGRRPRCCSARLARRRKRAT